MVISESLMRAIKKYNSKPENRERHNQYSKAFHKAKYDSDPEYRAKKLQYSRDRYADPEFREKLRAYGQAYRDARKDNTEYVEKRRAYAKAYKDAKKPIIIPKLPDAPVSENDIELMELVKRLSRGEK
jgi:hypothetical protein